MTPEEKKAARRSRRAKLGADLFATQVTGGRPPPILPKPPSPFPSRDDAAQTERGGLSFTTKPRFATQAGEPRTVSCTGRGGFVHH